MKIYELNGKEVKMFSIGELARALGRSSQTIRKWETGGVIPPTRFRDPTNKRLYPEGIVVGLKELSRTENLTQGISFETSKFRIKASALFKKVEEELLG